ncbi:MAG TPA: helix-turn-helix transcriptional regulator, partial [Thermomicrobiales bacterium]|nr:helix-turn-helix transcriptional regulator [Thermomicrobiales bacterium]
HGLVVLDPAVAPLSVAAPLQPDSDDILTDRERQVLALVALGLPNKAIAVELDISEHTVKFHVAAILGKLDAASRTEAVTVAARRGLLVL